MGKSTTWHTLLKKKAPTVEAINKKLRAKNRKRRYSHMVSPEITHIYAHRISPIRRKEEIEGTRQPQGQSMMTYQEIRGIAEQ